MNINQYKDFAEKFVKEAGVIIREGFHRNLEHTIKEDYSTVTEYDTLVNDMFIHQVKENFPDHVVIGEESSHKGESDASYVWYIDPIDGTKAFSMSLPLITCIISLTYKGEPILGIIYDPILERLVVAEKGKGVFFNGEPCSPSSRMEVEHSYMAYSVNMKYDWVNMFDLWKTFRSHHINFGYIHIGIAGLLLASGNIDSIVLPFFSDYEFYALKVIFDESGFITTNLLGKPIVDAGNPKQGLVVAMPKLHAKIIEIINPHTEGLSL